MSPAFEEFIDFVGKRVELTRWAGYSGGLDVESSYYSLLLFLL